MSNNEKRDSLPADPTSSKSTLLRHARALFAERGYDGVSVRDIVGAAGMNVSLVSYYFGGKEGLYRACLETLAESGLVRSLGDLPPPNTSTDFHLGVQAISRSFLLHGLEDPHGSKMAIREFCSTTPIFAELLDTVYRKPTHMVEDYLLQAQRNGLLKNTLKPALMASTLCSLLHAQNYFEEIRKKFLGQSLGDSNFFNEIVQHIAETFCSGVLA